MKSEYTVHVRLVGDGAKVDVFPDGMRDASSNHYACEEDIPAWIREKVATLKLLPDDGTLEGVGVRLFGGQSFWIKNDS